MKQSKYSPRVQVFRNNSIILNSTTEVKGKTDQKIPCRSTSRPLQQARLSKLSSGKLSLILLTNISRNQTHTLHKNFKCQLKFHAGNMKSFINRHNSKILNYNGTQLPLINPEIADHNPNIPLNGACLTRNLVYKVTIIADNKPSNTYIGMIEKNSKTRFGNHKLSFNNRK